MSTTNQCLQAESAPGPARTSPPRTAPVSACPGPAASAGAPLTPARGPRNPPATPPPGNVHRSHPSIPSLETLETSSQHRRNTGGTPGKWPDKLAPQSSLQETIHEPHESVRDRIIIELADSSYQLDRNTAFAMAGCGSVVRFYVDPDEGHVRPWLLRCRKRLCPLCGQQRSKKAALDIHLAASTMKDPRHMVLTIASSDHPLTFQLDRLRDSFTRLRRSKLWKSSVKGGVAVTECSWNPATNRWHPHLHILFDGGFIVHKQLASAWADASDGSFVVWLRRCDSAPAIAAELSKYIAKPANLKALPAGRLSEWNRATHRRRMLNRFGSAYAKRIDDSDPPTPLGPNTYAVSINRIMFLAKRGEPTPQRLLHAIASRYPTLQSYIYHAMPQLNPPEHPTHRTAELLKLPDSSRDRSPPQSRSRRDDEQILDARLFLAFTEFRREDDEGLYTDYDTSSAWSSSPL